MLAVYLKDLAAYFRTFSGYVFMSVFLLITSVFYITGNVFSANADFNNTLGNILFIFILVVPILTMRLMTDEVTQKTDHLLFTAPISFSEIVLGKYFAAVTVFAVTLLLTCLYPFAISFSVTWRSGIVGGMIGFSSWVVYHRYWRDDFHHHHNLVSAAIGTFRLFWQSCLLIHSGRSILWKPIQRGVRSDFG